MSKLKSELWINGRQCPVMHGGGQNIIYKVFEPTQWSVAWHHPDISEAFCIRHFGSVAERKQHLIEVRNENPRRSN